MSYQVLVHEDVVEALHRLDSSTGKRILGAMRRLREEPTTSRPGANIRKLKVPKDSPPLYRLRVGEYRVVFGVEGSAVMVTELVHRSEAYRGM